MLKIILALTYKQITEDIGALGHSEATSFAWLATNGSCYKLNFGALIKQSNSHKRAVLDYLRKVHFKNKDNEQATGCRAAISNSRTSVAAKLRNAEAIPNSANVITMNLKAL